MKRLVGLVVLTALLSAVSLQAQGATAPDPTGVQLVLVADGFNRPLFVTNAGDDSGRLFVVEQGGSIRIVRDGQRTDTPFLDVSQLISREALGAGYSERGLLGLAFSPDYANNGQFFIDYTDLNGNTVVARYQVSADNPDAADPNSAVTILTQQQPYANHNGGMLAFGPDGYLYIGFGDGGSGGDPENRAQNLGTWLGKILRVDVNAETFGVPSDNPYAGARGALPEIWAYGLRNPWRFSFDQETGDLYIGDVGQNLWEEVDFQPADSPGGENYGWNVYEATHPYSGAAAPANMVLPVAEYSHRDGISISGGYVYRGSLLPGLAGVYFYSDYGTGTIWSLYRDATGTWQNSVFMRGTGNTISGFGEDHDGELYVVDYGGRILRFEPA
jgi:glucose/arabinose dehydrogenase